METVLSLDREALTSRYLRNRERADGLFDSVRPEAYWHRPIVVTDPRTKLGEVIGLMKVKPEHPEDEPDPDRHQCVDRAEPDRVDERLGVDRGDHAR